MAAGGSEARMGRLSAAAAMLIWLVLGAAAGAQPWQPRDIEPPSDPPPAEAPSAERNEMRALITAQIEAMRRLDARAAFALATPELQLQYGSAENFLDQIGRDYAPLPQASRHEFLDIVLFRGYTTYRVILRDAEGRPTLAYYMLRRLADGSLRIAGCVFARFGVSA